ncbi:ELMO/CED-12 family-domain-containing protein [Dunaliella salina]|uniref:ELMO/CED-12 family-domain-containing protein n=1 Tax=Dunaliella salina TaxID=3046 RepID=A0ABQ7GDX3_DUNSA|nr:ELMO/CED-12 family-domain-containing protein [Dunaliella salina]|eukprot:KAF5832807.1 ELMO/CED-12 family-domain-containing protein [Dunaliella salina]
MRRRHTAKMQEPLLPPDQAWLQEQQVHEVQAQPGLLQRCLTYLRYWLGRITSYILKIVRPLKKEYKVPLIQEQQVQDLRNAASERYDETVAEHRDSLKRLWEHAFPATPFPSDIKSPLWKEMGWQGEDPGTDFRGSGVLGLQNLLYMAENHPDTFRVLLNKSNGPRADWEYPFACAGTNLTFVLAESLELKPGNRASAPAASQWPFSPAAKGFALLLKRMDGLAAFSEVYCAAFRLLDYLWLESKASYMDFNKVLDTVKHQVLNALAAMPSSIEQFHQFLRISSGSKW